MIGIGYVGGGGNATVPTNANITPAADFAVFWAAVDRMFGFYDAITVHFPGAGEWDSSKLIYGQMVLADTTLADSVTPNTSSGIFGGVVCPLLTEISVGVTLDVSDWSVTNIGIGRLARLRGTLDVGGNPDVSTIDLGALTELTGELYLAGSILDPENGDALLASLADTITTGTGGTLTIDTASSASDADVATLTALGITVTIVNPV